MGEWLDATVERILRRRPRRVLEIGAGTGLVLFPVAPSVERYVATDFSATAVDRLRTAVAEHGLDGTVDLRCRPADDFSDLPVGEFDLVVLNSVVQYFPGVGYLDDVIDKALGVLAPGGSVFVGDVRSLPLLEAFHVELARLRSGGDSAAAALARARRQQRLERELVVDPYHFEALVVREPRVSAVEVELRRGVAANEMARFRYDVLISTRPSGAGGGGTGGRRLARAGGRPGRPRPPPRLGGTARGRPRRPERPRRSGRRRQPAGRRARHRRPPPSWPPRSGRARRPPSTPSGSTRWPSATVSSPPCDPARAPS